MHTQSQHFLDLVCFVNKHGLYLSLIGTASSLLDVRKYYINEQAVTVNVSALKKNTLLFRSKKNNILNPFNFNSFKRCEEVNKK